MKNLCDLGKKEIEKKIEDIKKMVDRPTCVCRKCARAANDEKYVCKPVPLTPTDR